MHTNPFSPVSRTAAEVVVGGGGGAPCRDATETQSTLKSKKEVINYPKSAE